MDWLALALTLILVLFMHSERWFCNRSERREIFFWYIFIAVAALKYVFNPMYSLTRSFTLSMLSMIITLALGVYKVKHMMRSRLTPFAASASSPIRKQSYKSHKRISKDNSQEDYKEEDCLREHYNYDKDHIVSIIRQLLNELRSSIREIGGYSKHSRSETIKIELQIIEHFEEMNAESLNQVIEAINVPILIKDMRDHRTGKKPMKNKQRLLQIIITNRLNDLNLHSRAVLLDGLQKVSFTGIRGSQRYAAEILLSTKGYDLTILKRLVDQGGDYHNMIKLIYDDISNAEIREEIINHIKLQAEQVESRPLKVVSDIDDTLYCRLFDGRFPAKAFYPGVRTLYKCLDEAKGAIPGDLVFLTARPGGYRGVVEQLTYNMLQKAQLHTDPLILTGKLTHFFATKDMAKKKYENFLNFASLYPEYQVIFFGDSGQGDAMFGEAILKSHPDQVVGVFIHNIGNIGDTQKEEAELNGIQYFDTYIEAALKTFDKGLISSEQLVEVVSDATREIKEIKFKKSDQRKARIHDVNVSINMVKIRERFVDDERVKMII